MIRSIFLFICTGLSFLSFSQNKGLKQYKTDTTLIYHPENKLYEFVLEDKKQRLFWDTLKSDAFIVTKFKVKNNSREIIVLRQVRQDDGTITFFSDSPDKAIYPDSSIRIKMICSRRPGPFTSYVRIAYIKGKEEKQLTIPTWGYYSIPGKEELSNKLPAPEQKPGFVPAPIRTIVHEPETKEPVEKTKASRRDTVAAVRTSTVSAKKDYYIFVISGNEGISADSYLIARQDTIRSMLYDNKYPCFKLKARPNDALPVKIITKKNGVCRTTIFFNRTGDNSLTVRVPNKGEKYRYTGYSTMLNKTYKGYYFIKAPADDYHALKNILQKRGSQEYDIHQKFIYDRIHLPNDSAAAEFEKELRTKGIRATLEPATEWRSDMWEIENGKAVNVSKAYVIFNPGTTEQRIATILKGLDRVTFFNAGSTDSENGGPSPCPAYYITVHSNLYKDYMIVYDKLWNTREVKSLEQLHTDEAD